MPRKKAYYRIPKPIPEKDGWFLFTKYKPEPFEMVKVKDEDGFVDKAWWTGYSWDFGIQRTFKKIIKWQQLKEKIK